MKYYLIGLGLGLGTLLGGMLFVMCKSSVDDPSTLLEPLAFLSGDQHPTTKLARSEAPATHAGHSSSEKQVVEAPSVQLPVAEGASPPSELQLKVRADLPRAVRERYDQLDSWEQSVFADAAQGILERYKRSCEDWWAIAPRLTEDEFLSDGTLVRLRLQLRTDLEALLR